MAEVVIVGALALAGFVLFVAQQRRWHREQLQETAARLGWTVGWAMPAQVRAEGLFCGREASLHVDHDEDGPIIALQVEVRGAAPCALRLVTRDRLDALARRLIGAHDRSSDSSRAGISSRGAASTISASALHPRLGPALDPLRGLTVQAGDRASASTLLRDETGDLLATLARRGQHVELGEGRITLVRRDGMFVGSKLLIEDLRLLALAAAALERTAVPVAKGELPRFVWTGGGAPRCPYCRDDLDVTAPDAIACAACATLHHGECLAQAGGCTVFGCSKGVRERAPA